MGSCIFCKCSDVSESLEHIVPRSLGNVHYILRRGLICRSCNQRFSKFEAKVLSSEMFLSIRKKHNLVHSDVIAEYHANFELYLARLLYKMAFESLYYSRYSLWKKLKWDFFRDDILQGKVPAYNVVQMDTRPSTIQPIPRWIQRWRLKSNFIVLGLVESEAGQMEFYFNFETLHFLAPLFYK